MISTDTDFSRRDENYLDALGTERIPDPTTAGDFLRLFEGEAPLLALQETINEKRQAVWRRQGRAFRRRGVIDVDGTIAETTGECKEGMGLSYKGIWGVCAAPGDLGESGEIETLTNLMSNIRGS